MKRLKNTILAIGRITISLILIIGLSQCGGNNNGKQSKDAKDKIESAKTVLPLNISVYLDLSDRLTRNLTPSQMGRDTAIINHLVDIFIEDCRTNGKIINSVNHFQVFFYPAPNSSQIAQLAKGLNVDMNKLQLKQKKMELMEMKEQFQANLVQIYEDTMDQQDWVGCDIWGFFSNKEVDKLCIRESYRNILVILTDGYLYHAQNKIQEGNAYSYVLPQTLANPDSSLIIKRKDLSNLEVLILEVNPYDPKQRNQLVSTLENWLNGMGVTKYLVNETNLPINTETYIDSFLKN